MPRLVDQYVDFQKGKHPVEWSCDDPDAAIRFSVTVDGKIRVTQGPRDSILTQAQVVSLREWLSRWFDGTPAPPVEPIKRPTWWKDIVVDSDLPVVRY